MRTFLDWLQKCQFETQCREMQLAAGRTPKQRVSSYAKNDSVIASAKLRYSLNIGQLFAYAFPQPDSWQQFNNMTLAYLGHIAHLIGV